MQVVPWNSPLSFLKFTWIWIWERKTLLTLVKHQAWIIIKASLILITNNPWCKGKCKEATLGCFTQLSFRADQVKTRTRSWIGMPANSQACSQMCTWHQTMPIRALNLYRLASSTIISNPCQHSTPITSNLTINSVTNKWVMDILASSFCRDRKILHSSKWLCKIGGRMTQVDTVSYRC